MTEVAFLKRNADKWRSLEALLTRPRDADPDRLADLFLEITDDLAYARTFYPDSKTTAYLNDLAGRLHQLIYRNRREERGRLARFWGEELPRLFRRAHRYMLYALLIFLSAAAIGALSSANDDTFVRLILGDDYVNMTIANIENDDPMAVYKKMREFDMFFAITFNNVRVALLCFAMGLLASFGTAWILFTNGVMIGAFQYFFHQHGLLAESALTIYIHGTLELSAIVIAGGAGLLMGNSILFPGTYSRMASFRRGAKDGLKIVIGLVPVFIMAGFLEGFVTRYTAMPLPLSLLIIGLSAAFIVGYVIVYPIRLERNRS